MCRKGNPDKHELIWCSTHTATAAPALIKAHTLSNWLTGLFVKVCFVRALMTRLSKVNRTYTVNVCRTSDVLWISLHFFMKSCTSQLSSTGTLFIESLPVLCLSVCLLPFFCSALWHSSVKWIEEQDNLNSTELVTKFTSATLQRNESRCNR